MSSSTGVPRIALYARVSTNKDGKPDGQDPQTQIYEMRKHCEFRKWRVIDQYIDPGWSRATTSRPELNRLMADARLKKFDKVLVWKLDRAGCDVSHIDGMLKTFKNLGVEFESITEHLDMQTASGKLHRRIMTDFSAYERDLIGERVAAKLRVLKETRGIVPGPKRKILISNAEIKRRRKRESLTEIARSLDCSPALLCRRLNHPTNYVHPAVCVAK